MAEHGVTVTYETVRAWCERFGSTYAKRIRARPGKLVDTGHLDEVFLEIGGRSQYLRHAIDQDRSVLDILVQSHRSKEAAGRLFRKLLVSYCAPCAAAAQPGASARQKVEQSHRELPSADARAGTTDARFQSAAHANDLSIFGIIADLFSVGRHLLGAPNSRLVLSRRIVEWRELVRMPSAP